MYSIQQTYGGEDYSFRIDSHSLLAKHWDTKFVKMIKKLQAMGYPKPVLTAYAPDFYPTSSNPKSDKHPGYCSFQRFDPSSTVITQNSCLAEVMDYATDPVKIRFTSGHLIFSLGSFVEEVAYHPDIYFYGEELSLALRDFTCGYDLFAPNEVYLWHKYRADDPDAPRPWRDDKETYSLREFQSKTYLYSLLGLRGKKYRGKYGLGKARTLADYERYVGLDFKKQMASQHCLDNRPPPDPWNCWSELT